MEHSRDMTTPQSCAFWRVSYQPCGAGLARARGFSPLQLRKACAFLLLGMALHAGADESQCRIECIPWRGCVQMDNHEVEVILADGHSRSFVELTSEQLHWTLPGYEHKIPVQRIGATDTCETMGWVPRPEPRRVWDAFTFFNELQVLRLRLHTLAPVVHRFVVAEATKTHANGPKRLYFNESKEDADIQAFLPQVEHLIVDDLPDSSDRWQLEIFQRNALVRGLAEADAQDLIIVGDCDEIPNPHAVHLLRTCDGWDVQGPVHFHTRFYNFRFDLHFEALWYHPQLSTIQWLAGDRCRGQPENLRFARTRPSNLRLEDAGWHLSFFTDAQGVIQKLRSYAHSELDTAVWRNETAIRHAISQGKDYFYSDGHWGFGQLMDVSAALEGSKCSDLPQRVQARPDLFAAWLPAGQCGDAGTLASGAGVERAGGES